MNKKMKAYTLLATTFLALSPTTSFADESNQVLFGTEPVVVADTVDTETASTPIENGVDSTEVFVPEVAKTEYSLLADYSYYVGTWVHGRDGSVVVIDGEGRVHWDGAYIGQIKTLTWSNGKEQIIQVAIDNSELIVQLKEDEWMSGGSVVVAAPAGTQFSLGGDGDTTKDRLFIGSGATTEYGSGEALYREADIATVKAAQETGTESVVAAASSQNLDEVVEESVVAEESVQATEEVKAEAPETDGQSLVETVEAESKPVTPVGQTEQVVEQSAPQQSQASVAQPSTQHLPKAGEKTGLWLSLLGGMAIVLGGVGMVLNLKRKNS